MLTLSQYLRDEKVPLEAGSNGEAMLVGGSCLAASGGLNTCKCSLLFSFGQYVVQTKLVIIAHISWLHKVPHLRHHPDVRDVGARHAGRGLGLHHDLELTLASE